MDLNASRCDAYQPTLDQLRRPRIHRALAEGQRAVRAVLLEGRLAAERAAADERQRDQAERERRPASRGTRAPGAPSSTKPPHLLRVCERVVQPELPAHRVPDQVEVCRERRHPPRLAASRPPAHAGRPVRRSLADESPCPGQSGAITRRPPNAGMSGIAAAVTDAAPCNSTMGEPSPGMSSTCSSTPSGAFTMRSDAVSPYAASSRFSLGEPVRARRARLQSARDEVPNPRGAPPLDAASSSG